MINDYNAATDKRRCHNNQICLVNDLYKKETKWYLTYLLTVLQHLNHICTKCIALWGLKVKNCRVGYKWSNELTTFYIWSFCIVCKCTQWEGSSFSCDIKMYLYFSKTGNMIQYKSYDIWCLHDWMIVLKS